MHWAWACPITVAVAAAVTGVPCAHMSVGAVIVVVTLVASMGDALYCTLFCDGAKVVAADVVRCIKLVSHTIMAIATLVAVADAGDTWLTQPPPTSLMLLIYQYQFAAWALASIVDPFVHGGGTSIVYAVHHTVTLVLIAGSSATGWETVGVYVMLLSDLPDVFLSLARLTKAPAVFAVFAASFAVCRLLLLPFIVVVPAAVAAFTYDAPPPAPLVVALVLLQALNVAWVRDIVRHAFTLAPS
jgi:hypothetical protein